MQRMEVNGAVRLIYTSLGVKGLNVELNPICLLLALLGAHLIFHVSGLRVKNIYCVRSTFVSFSDTVRF